MSEPSGDPVDLAPGLTKLTALLLSVEEVESALAHLTRMAVVVIPDGPTCGITLNRRGRFTTIAHTGSIPESVDDYQYESGDGPCLEAMRTRSAVVVQELAAEPRWGEFPRVALAAEARGVCAFPLETADSVVGALNLYAHKSNSFPEPVQQLAAQFVEPASVLLAGVLRQLSQAELIDRFRAALASREVIDQAVGIVMALRRCGPGEAFSVLRKISNDRNVKLRTVAGGLVRAVATGARLPAWVLPADYS